MKKLIKSICLIMFLMLSFSVTSFAEENNQSFVLTAVNANSTIVEPVRISYTEGQTIKQALADSQIEFTGLEQGFIYEIEGVSANFSIYYDDGGYDLNAPADSITAICFNVTGVYSESAIALIVRMADYLEMDNNIQKYQAAADAYTAALKGIRKANATEAETLLNNLNSAISDYEAILGGERFMVSVSATQNGNAVANPQVKLTDTYGNVTTGTGSVSVISGEYKFSVSDGGFNRTEGIVNVTGDTTVTVSLPYGEWFGDILLLDEDKNAYGYTNDRDNHIAEYLVEDTAREVSSLYINAIIGDVPDRTNTKLRTVYTGTNGKDMSTTNRSWNSTATALTYLITQGMEGRSFELEAQFTGEDGNMQIQSYTINVNRVPTLTGLSVTADGTKLPLEFNPKTKEYSITTVSDAIVVNAETFGADYNVTGTGSISVPGSALVHEIVVSAAGAQNTYKLNVSKVSHVSVSLSTPQGVTAEVINEAGSVIAPVGGVYNLIPGEVYSCIGTRNGIYHAKTAFTASEGLRVTVSNPVATDWLSDLAIYNGSNVSNRVKYRSDAEFSSSNHTYNFYASDCNTTAYIQATATSGSINVIYTTQSIVAGNHGLSKDVAITTPVSASGSAKVLSYAIAKSGYKNTLTVRVSRTSGNVTYYQDYTVNLCRELHLTSLAMSCSDGALQFLNENGETAKFDRDITTYRVKLNREITAVSLAGAFPNTSDTTPVCGGYYATINGERLDLLDAVELTLDPSLDEEIIGITVCHDDGTSVETTYNIHVEKTDLIPVTIVTNPENAVVYLVRSLDGRRIFEEDGVYRLTPGGSYSYTVTCAGYVGIKENNYTAPDEEGTLSITLDEAPANDTLVNFDSIWPHLRQNAQNNGVISYKTPITAEDTELYWATQIGSGYDSNACGCPILVDGYLYTYSGSTIYKVDTVSGEIVKTGQMDHSSSFAINPPTYAEGMIFVGLSNGTVQAFNADTLESLWIYKDALGGQPNSSIVYHNGYIYTGFWVGEINEASFVCLNASDEDPSNTNESKLPTWYYTSKGGFYWAGAFVCDDYVLVGTDDGASGYTTGNPSLLSFNPRTGELLDSYQMNVTGDIRSSITEYDGKYYFTNKGGYFFEATVSEDGTIQSVRTLKLYNYADDSTNPAMSTSTPTIYNGRAYIGVSGTAQFGQYSGHNITVIDIPNWEIAYSVRTQGYCQSSGVLTTAYEEETGCVYVYFFDNFTPGKLRMLEDRPGQTEVSRITIESFN
ncbi:MAG: PQQ-binding-like beta-propeller repeat protein [Eubacteriales bacterium]|nr:PQQ-binding-like beta-propeller repeat protein [Eubacteriales bacterium]